nr:hypothetical protein [Nocardia brasiliensis]
MQSPREDSAEQPPTRAERHRKHQQPKLIHRIQAQELLRSAHAGEHDDRLVTLVLRLVDLGGEIPADPARGLPGLRDLRSDDSTGFGSPFTSGAGIASPGVAGFCCAPGRYRASSS